MRKAENSCKPEALLFEQGLLLHLLHHYSRFRQATENTDQFIREKTFRQATENNDKFVREKNFHLYELTKDNS